MSNTFSIKGNLVDIQKREIYPAEVFVSEGIISAITPVNEKLETFLLPGFIDAHVHIESSLLTPAGFARLAVMHGTVGTVSDPHEIANVLGMAGVEYMLNDASKVPFHFFFGAPSCVPATVFETAGASLNVQEVEALLNDPRIYYLSEMMNYPGVIYDDTEVHQKIAAAHRAKKPVDGHAPSLRGKDLDKYLAAGISTDHECFTLEEALEKLEKGMKILIREGSAARNFQALHPLIAHHAKHLMFCSDDKHPDSLLIGHINHLVQTAIKLDYDLFDVLLMACHNPVKHYKLPVGLLNIGDAADFIEVTNLTDFTVSKTFINGNLVFSNGQTLFPPVISELQNNFKAERLSLGSLRFEPKVQQEVIECIEGQLVTGCLIVPKEALTAENDYLKLVVYNRYMQANPAIGFIKNFGLKKGAIASSVAHDSHNIIAVGVNDEEIVNAINLLVDCKGGLSACYQQEQHVLPLPVAGLMTNDNPFEVAKNYTFIDHFSKEVLGATLQSPFMSLSFMALLVIPNLKLSDKGLFSGDTFSFVN
jgi:adenine deaminase